MSSKRMLEEPENPEEKVRRVSPERQNPSPSRKRALEEAENPEEKVRRVSPERDQEAWPMQSDYPRLPTRGEEEIGHPGYGGMVRGRGPYWWTADQKRLEKLAERGEMVLTVGACYMFLEDEITLGCNVMGIPYRNSVPPGPTIVFRYGNVFMGDHWIMRSVGFPKGHPDGEILPYRMVDVIEQWRKDIPHYGE